MIIDNKHVLIIGKPTAGKTTLSKKLKTKFHYIIHTDILVKSMDIMTGYII